MNLLQRPSSRFFFTALTFIFLGVALYSHVLNGEFVSDDYPYIVDNFAVRDLNDFSSLWRSFNTRFLVMLSFALNYRLARLDVAGYHLVNLLIHIINSFLVYIFVMLTFRMPALKDHPLRDRATSIAFCAGLIFLCHPIQTQAVSFITQRAVSMAVLFYLLAFIFYIKARVEQHYRFFPAAWLAILAGIFTKEMIITIPLALAVYELYFGEDFRAHWKRNLRDILPFAVLSVLLVWIFFQDRIGSVLGLKSQVMGRSFSWNYFLTEINVLRTYLRLLFLPVHQTHHYDYILSRSFFETETVSSFLLLAGLVAAAVRFFRRQRLISFTIVWFFIATSVEFIVVCIVNRGVLYEHWLYLAMVGFALFVSLLLHQLNTNAGLLKVLMALLVLTLCGMTYRRNFVWQTEIGFWEDAVRKSPQVPFLYLGSGTAYQHKDKDNEALLQYRHGLDLYDKKNKVPSETDRIYLSRIYNNMGLIFLKKDLADQAVGFFKNAYKINPANPLPYHNLAKLCLDTGKYRQAVVFLNKEMQLIQNDPTIYYGLGLAYLKMGQKQEAVFYFDKSARMQRRQGNRVLGGRIDKLVNELK